MTDEPEGIRLQKVLAAAGLGSRRACEALIERGRVEVNGVRVREQGMRVDPLTAVVRVDGKRVPTIPDNVVLVLNKPRGVVCTMSDEHGRPCVGDYLEDRAERLFHVGRLDADTEGLLIVTNDGELANRLSHPTHGVDKTYLATVEGTVTRAELAALRDGVQLEDGTARANSARVIQELPDRTMVELIMHEGRNRIVRRMMDAVGHPVIDLVRTRVANLHLGGQRPGTLRLVDGAELRELYTQAGL